MHFCFVDYNNSDTMFSGVYAPLWEEIESVINSTSIHLKASDQAGKQGQFIFDPVGTNSAIKTGLTNLGWYANVPMPSTYSFLGTDVDFVKDGVLTEVQFSNYPFLLNNIMRSNLLFNSKSMMGSKSIDAVVIITKCHIFPASNSTLYYEQAENQISALVSASTINVPIRLVGLSAPYGKNQAVFTTYSSARYSRTVGTQQIIDVQVTQGRRENSRCSLSSI